jgi:hypothetical protein
MKHFNFFFFLGEAFHRKDEEFFAHVWMGWWEGQIQEIRNRAEQELGNVGIIRIRSPFPALVMNEGPRESLWRGDRGQGAGYPT